MTAAGDALNQVIPALVRLARRPGAVLLLLATGVLAVFGGLGVVHGINGTSWVSWLPGGLAALLAVPVAVLAVRRHRLHVAAEEAGRHPTITQREIAVQGEAGSPWGDEREALSAAMAESALRSARYLPGLEAAQRAALRAAGGPVNAPYLRDDLRITLVALLGTLAAIPLGTLGAIITAILLLSP